MEEEGDRREVAELQLSVRVSLGTYRIFYESGKEDFLMRVRGEEDEREMRRRATVREERRKNLCRWIK